MLYYKNKFYHNTLTIIDYLVAVMIKQYLKLILYIFYAYHQEVARDIIQEEGIPKSCEEVKLDKDLAIELDWIQLPEELEGSSNKRALEEIEEISVGLFATAAYGFILKKACNNDMMNTLEDESAWGSQSSLVPN